MLDMGTVHPASPSRKDLLHSHRECDQQTGSSWQFLKSQPWQQRPSLSEAHPPWGHLYPVVKKKVQGSDTLTCFGTLFSFVPVGFKFMEMSE